MRLAILSDVHSNIFALQAVIDALSRMQIDCVMCLGDIVGYCAHPNECIDIIRKKCHIVVAGNHDLEVTGQTRPLHMGVAARQIIEWTRNHLTPEMLSYLKSLPTIVIREQQWVAVHGCYLNSDHYWGYVTQVMIEPNLLAIEENHLWPKIAFCGHTHQPLVGWKQQNILNICAIQSGCITWPTDASSVIINPGSVGQPRDQDPRASFAVVYLQERRVEIVRIAYEVEDTIAAIQSHHFPPSIGARLRQGH